MGQGIGHFSLSVSSGEFFEQNIALVEAVRRFLVEGTQLGIPAIVHAEALSGAIALGATWDPEGLAAMGRVIAGQLVPLGIRHVPSPVMDVACDIRWGRIGETYGEDVALVARMNVALVQGVQEPTSGTGLLVCWPGETQPATRPAMTADEQPTTGGWVIPTHGESQ